MEKRNELHNLVVPTRRRRQVPRVRVSTIHETPRHWHDQCVFDPEKKNGGIKHGHGVFQQRSIALRLFLFHREYGFYRSFTGYRLSGSVVGIQRHRCPAQRGSSDRLFIPGTGYQLFFCRQRLLHQLTHRFYDDLYRLVYPYGADRHNPDFYHYFSESHDRKRAPRRWRCIGNIG